MNNNGFVCFYYFVCECDSFDQLLYYCQKRIVQNVLLIHNDLSDNLDWINAILNRLSSFPEVNVYFDLHLHREFTAIDISLSEKEKNLLKKYIALNVDGFVISDMNLELTTFVVQHISDKAEVFFEYKLESEIYSVYRDRSGLKHRYNHADKIDIRLLNNLHRLGIKVIFKPAFRIAEILKHGREYFDAVFITTGEAEMLSMNGQFRNIHYAQEILNSYFIAGFRFAFLPFAYINVRYQWTTGVPASSRILEEIVEQINTGKRYLKTNSSGTMIYLEPISRPQVVYCPGAICPHSKINVIKLASAIHKLQIKSDVCINACRERCIQRENCIQMIGTIGGPCIHSQTATEKSDSIIISNMLAEERSTLEKKFRGTIL